MQIRPAPPTTISGAKTSKTSALLGIDYPGTRFVVLTEIGASVKAGEPVMRDRRQPTISFTSPISGTVAAIRRGARRTLVSLQIISDDQSNSMSFDIPNTPDRDNVRDLMLLSGLWPALRCRPYGYTPNPNHKAKALLITAIDTRPLAPDPALIISKFPNEFSLGIKTISHLIDTTVFLCKSSTSKFHLNLAHRAQIAEFSGPHPAGLAGTHIHALCPIGFDDHQVWHINYQDIISLGHLMTFGKPWYERVISLAGPGVKNPRLLTVPLGTDIKDITAGELIDQPYRLISGSALCGYEAVSDQCYLGQQHHQITVLTERNTEKLSWWRKPEFDTKFGGEPGPLIPTTNLDKLSPPGILAVPLLRALLVGDVERARDLGALELIEEDLALLSYACSSKTDYGPLLRNILDQLYKEGSSKLH